MPKFNIGQIDGFNTGARYHSRRNWKALSLWQMATQINLTIMSLVQSKKALTGLVERLRKTPISDENEAGYR